MAEDDLQPNVFGKWTNKWWVDNVRVPLCILVNDEIIILQKDILEKPTKRRWRET